MAIPPELAGEKALAGDGYSLRVIVKDTPLGTKMFSAQAREEPGAAGAPLAIFDVAADDSTGDLVLDLYLDGAATRQIADSVRIVACDLQYEDTGTDPVTLLRWEIFVDEDVTR